MHDIGRTQAEVNEFGEFAEYGEFEYGEYGESAAYAESSEYEQAESPFSELQEVEFASELLEVSNEQELEQFLGRLIGTVGQGLGRFARSDTGRALGGVLKSAARQALPVIGRAIGQWAQPQGGGAAGARIAGDVGQLLGLELEGLSAEDREFEAARQFVRFAGSAARQAILAPASADPAVAATSAASTAAHAYAPGLLARLPGRTAHAWPRSGRWERQGRSIVLYAG